MDKKKHLQNNLKLIYCTREINQKKLPIKFIYRKPSELKYSSKTIENNKVLNNRKKIPILLPMIRNDSSTRQLIDKLSTIDTIQHKSKINSPRKKNDSLTNIKKQIILSKSIDRKGKNIIKTDNNNIDIKSNIQSYRKFNDNKKLNQKQSPMDELIQKSITKSPRYLHFKKFSPKLFKKTFLYKQSNQKNKTNLVLTSFNEKQNEKNLEQIEVPKLIFPSLNSKNENINMTQVNSDRKKSNEKKQRSPKKEDSIKVPKRKKMTKKDLFYIIQNRRFVKYNSLIGITKIDIFKTKQRIFGIFDKLKLSMDEYDDWNSPKNIDNLYEN